MKQLAIIAALILSGCTAHYQKPPTNVSYRIFVSDCTKQADGTWDCKRCKLDPQEIKTK